MNLLDENVAASERRLLQSWRIRVRQIGDGIARTGIKDNEIIALLHQLGRPTLFTLDGDFYHPRWRHAGYCLVYLDVEDTRVAEFVRRVLRHPALNTKRKRMGAVIRAFPAGI